VPSSAGQRGCADEHEGNQEAGADRRSGPVEAARARPGGPGPRGIDQILQGDRNAVQRAAIVAARQLGRGGVGLGAIAASHFAGATTIAVDLDDEKLRIARNSGATHTVNSATSILHERLLELTDGRGPDVVIEAVGHPQTFRAAVEEVAFTGRVVYIGYAKELVAYETKLFVQKELDILGSRNALPADFQTVIQMLREGKFPVEDAVGSIVSLEEAPQILAEWSANPAKFTKIMVRMDSPQT